MKDGGGGPEPPTPLKDWFRSFALFASLATCIKVADEEGVDPKELWKAASPRILREINRMVKQFPEI